MRSRQVAWCIGVVGLLSACSGKYDVGHNADDSAGNGGAPGNAGASNDFAGGPNAKGGSPSDGGASNVAGAFSQGGVGQIDGVTPIAFCGVQFPPTVDGPLERPAAQVLDRVRKFIAGSDAANAPDPIDTTNPLRTQAYHYAEQLLDYYGKRALSKSAPGMTRFVEAWLPGTPTAETWSGLFRSSTLTQLMTSDAALEGGSGVLTDLSVLGLASSNGNPGITARGSAVVQDFLCRPAPISPPGVPPLGAQPPNQTRREQLESEVSQPACRACHSRFDNLGYSLERFDTVGATSTTDHGNPVDASGVYTTPSGEMLEFTDVSSLAPQLAQSCDVAICLTRRLLSDARAASTLPPLANEDEVVTRLAYGFSQSDQKLRELVTSIAASDALQQ